MFFPAPEALAPAAQRLIAVTFLMAALWFTQLVPVAVTSLLPLALYPLLGIGSAQATAAPYADRNVFLFLGGFLIALGLERSGLHRRLALMLVSRLGSSPAGLVFGFMLTTACLSMWISNSAATMLMIPIALALLKTLQESGAAGEFDDITRRLEVPTLLGIAYGASTGGFATLVGTPTNVAFRGFWELRFGAEGLGEISAADWMLGFMPASLLMLLGCGLLLTWSLPRQSALTRLGKDFFQHRLHELGPWQPAERVVAAVFGITAILWLTRVPLQFDEWQLLPGWTTALRDWGQQLNQDWSYLPSMVDDATIAMLMGTLLFLLPGAVTPDGKAAPILDWKFAEQHIPWGMLILIGSGFSIAAAFERTGLSAWLGQLIAAALTGQSPLGLIIGVCTCVTFLTEFTTNVATLNMLLPVLAGVAVELGVDPLLILLPATISASCAYMMPVATPPNAIAFSTGRVPMLTMVRYGLAMNLIGVVVVTLLTRYWIPLVFTAG
jgi:sodium-dependent dicarboxylate transporter 2/3/5